MTKKKELEIDEEATTLTVYLVTGSTAYLGYQPGEQFEAKLGPDQERRAKARGSIRVVRRGDETQKEEGDE